MKHLYILILTIGIGAITSCSDTNFMLIPQYSKQIAIVINSDEYFANGTLMRCKLKDTVTLGQFSCTGWIHFNKQGFLIQADLAKKTIYKEIDLPKSTTVFLNDSAIITHFWPASNLVIQDIECKGGNKIDISLYDNGKIKCCFLSKNQNIQGFPCEHNLFEPVCFYPNGNLQQCSLSKDFVVKEQMYKKSTQLTLDENGGIISIKEDEK